MVWEVYQEVGGKEPIQIISAYRSPQTNSMLRSRSRGVAQFSQHMLGKAIDFNIPGVPLEQIRIAGLRLQRGGVGFYPSSGSAFVHLDVGSVRHWPRMTRDQLQRSTIKDEIRRDKLQQEILEPILPFFDKPLPPSTNSLVQPPEI